MVKPKILLAAGGAAILILTYLFREMLAIRAKEAADALQTAENQLHTELGQSNLSLNAIHLAIVEQRREIDEIKKQRKRDYSAMIRTDSALAQQMLSGLNCDMGSATRLLDSVPFAVDDLRQQLNQLKPNIETVNQQMKDTLKPPERHDWTRAAELKVMIVQCAVAQIPLAVLTDQILTRAKALKAGAEKVYAIARWASTFLYISGVLLALYGLVTGHGTTGGIE